MNILGYIKRRRLKAKKALARSAQNARRWAEAAALWSEIAAEDRDSAHPVVQCGNMYTELGLYERACAAFETARASSSHRIHGMIGLAGVAERRGRPDEALVGWEAVLAAMANDGEQSGDRPLTLGHVLLKIAVCRFSLADFPNAERDLFFALAMEPELRHLREAVLLRGRLIGRHDPKAAHRVLRDGQSRFPDDGAIRYEFDRVASVAGVRHADGKTAPIAERTSVATRDRAQAQPTQAPTGRS